MKMTPKYSFSDAAGVAISLATRAIMEVRALSALISAMSKQPGPRGKDGMGFDDFKVEHDGERTFTFKYIRGNESVVCGKFSVPAMIYRGVFRESEKFTKDDCVTWNGSMWVAQKDTQHRPGENGDWILAVKRGRDAKEPVSIKPIPGVVKI